MGLAEALLRMPPNFYLKCAIELDEDDESPYLTAVIMEEPPEGGWDSLDQYFGSPGHGEDKRLKLYKFDDACRIGVTGAVEDPQDFDRLLVEMINHRWPAPPRKDVWMG